MRVLWEKEFISYRIILLILFLDQFSLLGAEKSLTLSGYVLDSQTHKGIGGANIELLGEHTGTTTDSKGYFSFHFLKNDKDTLKISFIGYKTKQLAIVLSKATTCLKIYLIQETIKMPEVKIVADRNKEEARSFSFDPSTIQMSSENLGQLPSVIVPDLYRALQKVPGILSANEASPYMSVRGGNFDQNLVLLDGAVVYYPFHFLGLSSSFNMDMIDNIYFSLGNFSVKYGNRLSSVLSIKTKKPSKEFQNRFNLSLTGFDLTMGGKIKNSLGWIFSGRTSYFDIIDKFSKSNLPYRFYDGLFKLEWQDKNQLWQFEIFRNLDNLFLDDKSIEYLYAHDGSKKKIDIIDRNRMKWANGIISLSFYSQLGPKMYFSFQSYSSGYKNNFQKIKMAKYPDNLDNKFGQEKEELDQKIADENEHESSTIENNFNDLTLKAALKYHISQDNWINCGNEVIFYNTAYGWDKIYTYLGDKFNLFFDHAPMNSFTYHKKFSSASTYIEGDQMELFKKSYI